MTSENHDTIMKKSQQTTHAHIFYNYARTYMSYKLTDTVETAQFMPSASLLSLASAHYQLQNFPTLQMKQNELSFFPCIPIALLRSTLNLKRNTIHRFKDACEQRKPDG